MNDHHHLHFSSYFPHEAGLVACFCWVFFLRLIWKRTFEEKWQIFTGQMLFLSPADSVKALKETQSTVHSQQNHRLLDFLDLSPDF